MKKHKCQVCRKNFNRENLYALELLRPSIFERILKENDPVDPKGFICNTDLHHYRALYIKSLLQLDKGSLTERELNVVDNIKKQEILTENINIEFANQLTFGEKVADRVAAFGGSWYFIFTFISLIIIWMGINISFLFGEAFDPYPFILLNLFLSCLAAFQAPVIMMSQNRQALKDQVKSDHEYAINLKAELQIRLLQSKLDRFMNQEWARLLEIQEIQLELCDAILESRTNKRAK